MKKDEPQRRKGHEGKARNDTRSCLRLRGEKVLKSPLWACGQWSACADLFCRRRRRRVGAGRRLARQRPKGPISIGTLRLFQEPLGVPNPGSTGGWGTGSVRNLLRTSAIKRRNFCRELFTMVNTFANVLGKFQTCPIGPDSPGARSPRLSRQRALEAA